MTAHPLEPDRATLRAWVDAAMERIADHLDSLDRQPATSVANAAEVTARLREPLPEQGVPLDALLTQLFEETIPCSYNTAGPGYLAYIPSGGIFHSALADLISAAVNRYAGVWIAAPGLAQLEASVIDWFCQLIGYPSTAGGFHTTGGSLANWTALVTARRERLPENFLDGTLYVSEQVHHSVLKAALMAGFPPANVRAVAGDRAFRLDPADLSRQVEADRQRGQQPFLVVASAGTTNTGAIDPLPELAEFCQRQGLWLHVDAAYGGFFSLTDRGRLALAGLERADSVTLDPHKSLFLPYGSGALLARDPAALRRSHSVSADYMPPLQNEAGRIDFSEISPELTRPVRALRAWLPIKLHGIGAFRDCLDEKLDLARWTAEEIRRVPELEVLAEPELSLVAFRWRPAGLTKEQRNQGNRRILERVNRRQRVFLTDTVIDGRVILRICILSFRTHRDRVEQALEDLREAVAWVSESSRMKAADE